MLSKKRRLNHVVTESVPRYKLFYAGLGIFAAIILIVIVWFTTMVNAPGSELEYTLAEVDGHKFHLEVADTPEKRQKGLGGRKGINEGEGMFFVFERPGTECFWMKDVGFSIDILWFDADKKLIHILPELRPETYPNSFCPPAPAKYVVELVSGTTNTLSLEVGDTLTAKNL